MWIGVAIAPPNCLPWRACVNHDKLQPPLKNWRQTFPISISWESAGSFLSI